MLKDNLVLDKKHRVFRSDEDEKFFLYWGFEKKEWELVFDGEKVFLSSGKEMLVFKLERPELFDLEATALDSEDGRHEIVLRIPGVTTGTPPEGSPSSAKRVTNTEFVGVKATAHLYKDGVMIGMYRVQEL